MFYFKNNKYIYLEKEKTFIFQKFILDKFTNKQIFETFGVRPQTFLEYNYLLNKFGKNLIFIYVKSFIRIFLEQMYNPLYIYQIFSCILWFNDEYSSFAVLIIICTFLILLLNTYYIHKNNLKISNIPIGSQVYIKRNFVSLIYIISYHNTIHVIFFT